MIDASLLLLQHFFWSLVFYVGLFVTKASHGEVWYVFIYQWLVIHYENGLHETYRPLLLASSAYFCIPLKLPKSLTDFYPSLISSLTHLSEYHISMLVMCIFYECHSIDWTVFFLIWVLDVWSRCLLVWFILDNVVQLRHFSSFGCKDNGQDHSVFPNSCLIFILMTI